MTIIAGPCLLNNNQAEIDNCIETARQLYTIDPEIRFRCKLWGGGTLPDRYISGIGRKGLNILTAIKSKIGIEIRDVSNLQDIYIFPEKVVDFIWVAARAAQNYTLLKELIKFKGEIFIKRNPGMTVDELIGIHDICRDIHGYTPTMIERGINTFCRTPEDRYTADFDGMIRIMHERPDIKLMFDPSHCCGYQEYIFPLIKAACAIGVDSFMLEVYADAAMTQTDKAQALSIEKFKPIYEYIKNQEITK